MDPQVERHEVGKSRGWMWTFDEFSLRKCKETHWKGRTSMFIYRAYGIVRMINATSIAGTPQSPCLQCDSMLIKMARGIKPLVRRSKLSLRNRTTLFTYNIAGVFEFNAMAHLHTMIVRFAVSIPLSNPVSALCRCTADY